MWRGDFLQECSIPLLSGFGAGSWGLFTVETIFTQLDEKKGRPHVLWLLLYEQEAQVGLRAPQVLDRNPMVALPLQRELASGASCNRLSG